MCVPICGKNVVPNEVLDAPERPPGCSMVHIRHGFASKGSIDVHLSSNEVFLDEIHWLELSSGKRSMVFGSLKQMHRMLTQFLNSIGNLLSFKI